MAARGIRHRNQGIPEAKRPSRRWLVRKLNMPIRGHRTLFLNLAKGLLLFVAVAAALPAFAIQDKNPPVLTSFTFSPQAVDVTNAPATISATAQATDDLSGVTEVAVEWVSPDGTNAVGGGLGLSSGTNLNGTYTSTFTIPQFVEPGTWNVAQVYVRDNAGNSKTYYQSDLQALGFPTTLQVTSTQDKNPPVLTSFTFSPQAVDVTNAPATISATAQATDDLSGVTEVAVEWVSPDGTNAVGGGLGLSSGTNLNGTYTSTFTIPQFVEPGTWNVAQVYVRDNAGNSKTYYQSDLQALGFPTTLQVTSTQDKNPPVLTSFTFSPQAVDVTNAPATISATAQATDDLSGVTEVAVEWVSPDGTNAVGGGLGLSSGTNLNGTYTSTFTIPQFVEPGTWNVAQVYVRDNAGNSKTYYQSDLQALGFPTTLQVTSTQDKNPPVLTSFTFSPQAVDVTNAPATISATAQATDDLSGVTEVAVEWVSPDGTNAVGGGLGLSSGTNLNGTYTSTFTIPQFVEPGTWNVAQVYV